MTKRIVQFHKDVIISSGGSRELIKCVVKHTDNLRSQVAKNSCMTLQVIYSELPTKDLDSCIDVVLSSLLKKSTDTNHFVSEQAEKALVMVCHACNESKLFASLQAQPGKSALLKQKICVCYGNLISKLGPRIGSFRECVSLVRACVLMLSEGA